MPTSRAARWWHGVVAALVLAAIILQLAIAVRVSGTPHATTTGVLRGSSLPGRIIRVLSFFTIQSNVLSGIVSARLAMRAPRAGAGWRAVRLAALTGITVTGIVYSAVLADVHEPHGAAETLVNAIVHYVVPVMMVLGWALFDRGAGGRTSRRVDRATVLRSLLFPLTWTVYTVVRGAIWHWYPYGFVDVPIHGYAVVAANGLLVLVLLAVVSLVFAVGDARLPVRAR